MSKRNQAVMDTTHAVGPVSYDSAARPTITFNRLKTIESIEAVVITALGYIVDVVSISGNIATYRVQWPAAHTHVFTGNVLATHTHAVTGVTFTGNAMATHQHDITTVGAGGGGAAMTEPAAPGPLETAAAGQTNTNAVDAASAGTPTGTIGGTADAITGGTPAGTNANQTLAAMSEVPDTTVLNGVTFYASAFGYPSNVRRAHS